jgi:molybdate/tungstate transport system substrate-binding protein
MKWMTLLASVAALCAATACGKQPAAPLKVLHAGSLSVPFARLESLFEAQNPGLDVQREAHGSATAIRQLTELGRECDVIASADYRLIDQLMVEADPPCADWNVLFAGNSLGLAQLDAGAPPGDWLAALRDPDTTVGGSNPNYDPCGYRALFALCLADRLPGNSGLLRDVVLANSNVTVEETDGAVLIRVPSDVRYSGRLIMRPKETDLLALVEAGALDRLIIYSSVARQHALAFQQFPDEVSLSNPAMEAAYGTVSVCQYADDPERSTVVQAGPIVYGLTIPTSCRSPEPAERFVRLLLSDAGRAVFQECGQPPLVPPVVSAASRQNPLEQGLLNR